MKFPIQLILIIIAKKNDLKNQYMEKKMGWNVFKSYILQILCFVEWKSKTVKPLI